MEHTHTNHITTSAHHVNKNHFDIKQTLSAGWQKFKSQWSNLLMALFAYLVASLPFGIIDGLWSTRLYQETTEWNEFFQEYIPASEWVAGPSETALYVLFFVAMFVWSIIISYNWFKSYSSVYDGHVYKFSEMFVFPNKTTFENFTQYILGTILYAVGTLIGLVLLVVPGIYFALRFQYALFLIVDKKMRVGEAFTMSSKMTENIKWKLFGFEIVQGLLCIGILILGIIALIVGVIPAAFIVFGWLIMANVELYRKLYSAHN